MPPRTAASILAEELCRKYPDHSSLGLAKKLRADHPECFASVENARSYVRTIRGANGQPLRKYAKVPRAKGRAGTKMQCPPSAAEAYLPFTLDGVKRLGILSDTHIPYHDETALTAAVDWLAAQSPDALLLNGDYGDFYTISRWQRDPRKRSFREEVESMQHGLAWLRECFPKARLVYKKGNHDERWDHLLWNRAPELVDLPCAQLEQILQCEKYGVEMVGDQRPVMAGKLPIMHGHEFGKSGIAAPVNPARGAFLRTQHTVLVGHSHQTSTHAQSDLWHSEAFCWSTGCLCSLCPEYSRVNKWNHGFAFVEVATDGSFNVQNLRVSDGVVRSS